MKTCKNKQKYDKMRQFSLLFSSIEAKNHKIDINICEIESHN